MTETIVHHRFRAMGTTVTLIVGSPGDERGARSAAAVERAFAREEQRFSRFRSDSELVGVNASAGRSVRVSEGFRSLLRFALDAAARTDGLFDPTILPALERAGYDRDFERGLTGSSGTAAPPAPCGRWVDVELLEDRVRLPEGVALDFGGVAKGWTVDLALRAAARADGFEWTIINAGGDLRIIGTPPREGVPIRIEDPEDPDLCLARLRLADGALATSSVTARAWGPGLHHLIDPRTGLPASRAIIQATVWEKTCAEAEVRAKWALLAGEAAIEKLACVLVASDGRVITNLGSDAFSEMAS